MMSPKVAIVLAVVIAGTYLLRVGGLLLIRDGNVPALLDHPLALLGPAAVTALVVSIMSGGDAAGVPVAAVIAVVAGFVVARRTGNLLYSLAIGLPVMWAMSAAGL